MITAQRPDSATLVAGRYELIKIAGAGGMGVVWRAKDRETGEDVALKLTQRSTEREIALLDREARFLMEVKEPSFPRYIHHGVADGGARYLATEWLDGEDLCARLGRGPLDVDATLEIGSRLAEALAALHAHGVIHCDVKPANVFLVGGKSSDVKLIDFGIARRVGTAHRSLKSGIFGTPFYMAPEQARMDAELDGRADLYSLGCLIFECLTGQPPFLAESNVALLAKILLEEAPLLSEVRAGVPPALAELVARLLAKEAAARPPDASTVARRLAALREIQGGPPPSWATGALTQLERRLVSVVLATDVAARSSPTPFNPDSTIAALARFSPPLAGLQQAAAAHGARLEVLGDGSIAAALSGSEAPTDLAAAAARCALALRDLVPEAQVALVTGWEVFTGTQPLGRVIDRAAALLDSRAGVGAIDSVLLDPMTAALLDDRFTLEGEAEAPTLAGAREHTANVRRLLGKPVPFLGREREIAILDNLIDECVSESAAWAVLVTGAPGVGKSRLRGEFVQRVRERHEAAEIWHARADPMRQKAPFGLLGQLLRSAARLSQGEPLDLRQQKLAARVARCVEAPNQRRVTEFLGEIVGTALPGEDSLQLHAARLDPMLMGDQLLRAWLDFLEAECRAHPVLMVMEDLHWGDLPTVKFVDTALRVLADRPLMVLAIARPELSEELPSLWAERRMTKLKLGQLPRRACEDLVRGALGEQLSPEELRALVARSAQNPFMLEELVRAVSEGRGGELPETVLAMMHARLGSLAPEARRLLRAGSFFGEVFWRGSVVALLGHALELDVQLDELERREWVTRRRETRFHGQAEYTFRHGLIREAAYDMLTDEDRALGHRLAGEWLTQAGETDAMALARHFDRGGEPARAVGHYASAAKQALEGNDLSGAIERAERGVACGASGTELGDLCLICAEAHRWQGNFAEARRWARQALDLFPAGSDAWFSVLREELASLVDTDERERLMEMAERLDNLWADPAAAGRAQVIATVWLAIRLYVLGLHERAETFHSRLQQTEARFAMEPVAYASIAMEAAFRQGFMMVDMDICGSTLRIAAERFEQAGDLRNAYQIRVNLGHVYNELGAYQENFDLLSSLLAEAERLGLAYIAAVATSYIGKTLLSLGRPAEAKTWASKAAKAFADQGDQRMEAVTRAYLAMILSQTGESPHSEGEAGRAIEALQQIPTLKPFALAVLANILLRDGRPADALEPARQAAASVKVAEEGEALIRLVYIEVLEAVGERKAARDALAEARERLLERANKIGNEKRRKSFLENVPENARTLSLSQSWLESAS